MRLKPAVSSTCLIITVIKYERKLFAHRQAIRNTDTFHWPDVKDRSIIWPEYIFKLLPEPTFDKCDTFKFVGSFTFYNIWWGFGVKYMLKHIVPFVSNYFDLFIINCNVHTSSYFFFLLNCVIIYEYLYLCVHSFQHIRIYSVINCSKNQSQNMSNCRNDYPVYYPVY